MNRKARGKQEKGVRCRSHGPRVLDIDWIIVSHVLEIPKKLKTEKCLL